MPRRSRLRAVVLLFASAMALVAFFRGPSTALGQMGADRAIIIETPVERALFGKLRCMCGGCARLDLATCTCGYAADRRDEIRAELKSGMTPDEVVKAYVNHFGTDSLEIPSNEGANRLLYLVPISLVLAGAVGLVFLIKRLGKRGVHTEGEGTAGPKAKRDDYDEKLDDELKRLDDE